MRTWYKGAVPQSRSPAEHKLKDGQITAVEVIGRYSKHCDLEQSLTQLLEAPREQRPTPSRSQKKRQNRLSSDEVDRLVDAFTAGTSVSDLAADLRIHRATVAAHLDRRGITDRGAKLDRQQIAEAVQLYNRGWSLTKIGRRLDVHPTSVRYRLRQAGLSLRPRPGWST